MPNFPIAVLPGDGIGPDVVAEGLKVLRAVVAGKAGDLPIQWTYYHLADQHGRRASLVFTIESSLLERFAHIDRELLESFHFLAEGQPQLAAPAGKTASRPRGIIR